MCGIAGILSHSDAAPVQREELVRMAHALRHRGPDDEGYFIDPQARCGLAFRRLAIIDLATGNQPVSNENATVWAVFNGEIYNYRDLRDNLIRGGHTLRTHSDSETIVHLYEDHGAEALRRLHGMFAIALWDARRRTLLLARDRLGKKPLICANIGDRLYFASEAKAILAVEPKAAVIDPQALHSYLTLQYVPAPQAIYRGWWKVQPGHSVELSPDAGPGEQRSYWSPPAVGGYRGTYADARIELEQRLRTAVERRLISEVPLGAFLSGGVDSSIVVALMKRLGVSPLRTFSIGFGDAEYDETRYAREVASMLGAEHHEYRVEPNALADLDTLAWHYDEPFADSSAIPTWHVSRQTRQHVTVALTGDGGDEAFAGYDRYRATILATKFDWLPRSVRTAIAAAARLLPHGRAKSAWNRAYRFLEALPESPFHRYARWIEVFSAASLAAGYRDEFRARVNPAAALEWAQRIYDGCEGSAAERANRLDLRSYLPFDLLTKVDIASMACGLECRAPLLDHELIEFAFSLPMEWKCDRKGGKRILRDWAGSLLPAHLLDRPKMGFGVPVGRWFRQELRGLLRERLMADDALTLRIFRRESIAAMIDAHESGRANHEHRLWSLLMLESWRRVWNARLD